MLSEGVCIQDATGFIPDDILEMYTKAKEGKLRDIEVPKDADLNNIEEYLEMYYNSPIRKLSDGASRARVILDGSDLQVILRPNKHSRLDFTVVGENKATISDGGEVLATCRPIKRPEWLNEKLSNGMPIEVAMPIASEEIINVVFSLSCMNYNTNRGCRYCNLFATSISKKIIMLPKDTLREWAKYQGEAVQIATDHRWRGTIAISGGALPPRHRPEYLERMGIVLSALREYVGEETLKELRLVYNHYPPEDFADMYKWKEMGIQATSIDIEVMDSAYFAAICPGKNRYKPHAYWKKAQEAAVEVFGPGRSVGCIVMGIEPMSTLLKGVEERLSKGIIPLPLTFQSAPGSAYWGFRPPTAEWLVEASNKMADSFLKHAPKFLDPNRIKRLEKRAKKEGPRRNRSSPEGIVLDEVQRRMQGFM